MMKKILGVVGVCVIAVMVVGFFALVGCKGSSSTECNGYADYPGMCGSVQICCPRSGTGDCYYKTEDGEEFPCSGTDTSSCAGDLYNYCSVAATDGSGVGKRCSIQWDNIDEYADPALLEAQAEACGE